MYHSYFLYHVETHKTFFGLPYLIVGEKTLLHKGSQIQKRGILHIDWLQLIEDP